MTNSKAGRVSLAVGAALILSAVACGPRQGTGTGGVGGTTGGTGGISGTGGTAGTGNPGGSGGKFSFFVTSLNALVALSGSSVGFGGDLRFGETGAGAGLRGADKICAAIAERSMPGSSSKQWRAFLSATTGGPGGGPVHAIDRVGNGPWYDRLERIVANTKADLVNVRPNGAHPAIINDLPNEDGVPNQQPDPTQGQVDNHDTLTGSNDQGQLFNTNPGFTCNDWTSAVGSTGTPRCGHSWPRSGPPGGGPGGLPPPPGGGPGGMNMAHWISALNEAGCAPGVNLIETGPPNPFNPTVGSGGGYGGFYCFALTP